MNESANELIHSFTWDLQDDENNDQASSPSGMMVANVKNMIVQNEGKYLIELIFEGEKIGEQFLRYIRKKELKGNDNNYY
jgi:hypothetical protein